MRQLILDLLPASPPSLDNFVAGPNEEAVSALTRWLAGGSGETALLLYGPAACGRSHLLQASGFHYIDAAAQPDLADLPAGSEFAVDNVQALSESGQIALFNLFNHLKRAAGKLLTAADQPASHLRLREDLRTRLGSGLIYRLHALTDQDKAKALASQAGERALKLTPEMITYVLHHAPRDMRVLSALIVALDRYTLENKRPVTLPLLRELLNETLPLDL